MDAKQFKTAVRMAINSEIKLPNVITETTKFDGFGLDGFKPIHCTLAEVAAVIRWQAVCFDGTLDSNELESMRFFKNRFIVYDEPEEIKIALLTHEEIVNGWTEYSNSQQF